MIIVIVIIVIMVIVIVIIQTVSATNKFFLLDCDNLWDLGPVEIQICSSMSENIYLECISGEAWSLDFRRGTQQAEFEKNQIQASGKGESS